MVVRQGDLWWADLPPPAGSEPGYRRPVIIVQSDLLNRTQIGTVVCVAVSSNLRLAEAPGNVRLPREASGLPMDSVANTSQILTLDRTWLESQIGRLLPDLLRKVFDGIALVLAR